MEQPIRNRYFELLQAHVARPAEEHLAAIAELGRALVQADVPPEEIAEIHEEALQRLAQERPDMTLLDTARLLSAPLMEMLMAYGLAFRAWNAQLQREIAEHKQAEEELRQRQLQLSILNRLGVALAGTLELASVYRIAFEHLAQLVYCPCFGISLYDPATRTLRAEFMLDDGELIDAARFPPLVMDMDAEPTRGRVRAIATRQPEIIAGYPTITEEADVLVIGASGDNRTVGSAMYVPMVVRGQVTGLLEMQSYRVNAYGTEEAALLGPVANQIGLAIENARLYQAEQERRHIAETLRQASTVLSSTLELDEVLGLILQQLRQVIPYDSASVQRLQGERLEVVACHGFAKPDTVMGLVFPLDPKFPNYGVVTTKAVLAVEDIAQDYPHFKDEADTYKSGRIGSWLGAPLMVKDEIIGMIAVDRAGVHPYAHEEGQLAMTFANQAAVAMENARLYDQARQKIAESERAEEALREERDNLINIFEAMEDGVYIVNQQYDLQYVNPVLQRDFGPFEGRKCYEYFHEREEACPWCKNQDVFAGKTVRWEWYSFKNQRTYDLIDTPLRNPDGSISKLEIFRDITERKRAEEALRVSARQWQTTFDALSDSVCLIDLEGTILRCNEGTAKLLGKPLDEIIGATCWELVHGTSEPIAGCPIVRMQRSRRRETLALPVGNRWLNATVDPLLDEEGSLIGAVHVIADITERVRAEEKIKEYSENLQRLVEERTAELREMVNLMTGREIRMAELKEVIRQLHTQLEDAGLTPVADDPLVAWMEE